MLNYGYNIKLFGDFIFTPHGHKNLSQLDFIIPLIYLNIYYITKIPIILLITI